MQLNPIGFVRSDFEGRFGTPRQPGLVTEARAELVLNPPYNNPDALRGLEGCSHVWLIFGFHAIDQGDWRPTVRPPRLGGNRRYGVFATRSPFRPNGLGLSVVRLTGLLEPLGKGLALAGQDLMNGTPVFDIKPYLPDIECLSNARPPDGFESPNPPLPLRWDTTALTALADLHTASEALKRLIEQTIAADPRPAYHKRRADERYGMRIAGHEVAWRVIEGVAHIESVEPAPDTSSP